MNEVLILENQKTILRVLRKLLPDDSLPADMQHMEGFIENFDKDPYMTGLIDGCIEKIDEAIGAVE